MPKDKGKIDLSLLKNLVSELEGMLTACETMPNDLKADKNSWVTEMAKASGLAAAVSTEAALLMGDITHVMQGSVPGGKQDFLEKILGGIKGPGSAN